MHRGISCVEQGLKIGEIDYDMLPSVGCPGRR